jgi:ubiquinone/menaquinone biosynthesis C-methylase UbiE
MPSPWFYDWMYRLWAPWDAVGLRKELVRLLDTGKMPPTSHPRVVDLGCGTGANVVHLAQCGYRPVGVDFSTVALRKARERASDAGVADRCRFVQGDLTATTIPGVDELFDLLLDFGTLDDLDSDGRHAMAATVKRLSKPGAVFVLWCFYGDRDLLPRFSLTGPSRVTPLIAPGEERELFGGFFDIELFSPASGRTAAFLMTRR